MDIRRRKTCVYVSLFVLYISALADLRSTWSSTYEHEESRSSANSAEFSLKQEYPGFLQYLLLFSALNFSYANIMPIVGGQKNKATENIGDRIEGITEKYGCPT